MMKLGTPALLALAVTPVYTPYQYQVYGEARRDGWTDTDELCGEQGGPAAPPPAHGRAGARPAADDRGRPLLPGCCAADQRADRGRPRGRAHRIGRPPAWLRGGGGQTG